MMEITIHEDIDGPVTGISRVRSDYCALEIRHNGCTFTIYGGHDRVDAFSAVAGLLSGKLTVTPMPMDEAGTSGAVLLSEVS